MPIRRSQFFPVFLVLCGSCTATESTTTYSITLDEDALITKPEQCNDDITNGGGDLIEAGVRFRGKCNGAGISPSIETEGGERYLSFVTDPAYEQGENRTRTELALTSNWFPFGKPVYIGFRLRVPEDADKSDGFFYLMQLWQCAGVPPIAGVRMNRGRSHRINFMTRGDSRAASMAAYELSPDTWSSFVIRAEVDPTGENGTFSVWNDPNLEPEVFNGAYGFAEDGACRGLVEPPQRFRLKFGIYKRTENNRRHEVNYDDIRIGSSFDAVSPWSDTSLH